MKITLVLILAFIGLINNLEINLEDGVFALEDINAQEFIKTQEAVFVKFYAPWCGHCKQMAPAYAELAEHFHRDGSNVKIAKIDATVHKQFPEQFGIEGFPTIKLFINGKPIDYNGERTKDAMTAFINKKVNQGTKIIKTAEEFKEFAAKRLSIVVFLPEENSADMKTVQQLTSQYEDVEIAVVLDKSLLSKNIDYEKALIMFRNFDDGMKILNLTAELNLEIMTQFINAHKYPVISEFDQEAANRIFGEKLESLFFFDDDFSSQQAEIFKAFAKEQNEKGAKIVFSLSKVTQGFGQKLAEYLGVAQNHQAVLIKFVGDNLEKFRIQDISAKGLLQGLEDIKSKVQQPFYKSSKIPAKNDEPVLVVVGDNFQEIVLDSGKFVLLEAYAPWCGHCKTLEPIYKELAEKLMPFKNKLTIAKMDATGNEHPRMPIQGFPTLRLFKPGQNEPVDYAGDRSFADMLKFLEKETGLEFSVETSEHKHDHHGHHEHHDHKPTTEEL